jgi:hypothetical protein
VAGVNTAGTTTSTLEQLNDGVAKVTVKSEMSISVGDDGPIPAGTKVDLKSERAAGEYSFDTKTGRLKEYTHETVINGTVTSADRAKPVVVGLTIRQKQTVTVTNKNPVRD